MTVEALIQAAGRGSRLGLGPKAFVTLGGMTLLERAVGLVSAFAASVLVAVADDDIGRANDLVGSRKVRVMPGGATRSETTRRLIDAASEPWLLLHDVVHPFVAPDLVTRLLSAGRETGAAAPGLPNTEFVYSRDGTILHRPGDVLVGQKPVVVSLAAVRAGYAAASGDDAESDPSLIEVLARAGVRTAFVPGSADNIKITSLADLRLAEALGRI
ncbi:MAG: 2-C-methyl-D-erythritol 4-phosphate cytidylyltransferase [Bauldia sp.]|nr:2-C-methyl-D-erythritol 4-phosphate cytidylyltransferase [Bauldia sp.]